MKVLHVVQGYTPAIGGTERLIQKVSEKLVAQHGDEVTVFTTTAYNCELFWRRDQPQLPEGTEVINGVTVRRFPVFNRFNELRRVLAGATYKLGLPFNDRLRALYNGPIIPGMAQAIAASGADIVAASSFPLLHMHYALSGGRRGGMPVVFHGGIHTADDYGFNRPMIYEAIHQADAYVAYTSYERDHLVEQRGIEPHKITVVGVGVDLEPFVEADGRALRARFGWGQMPVVAFIGQQVPHKGIDLLMKAMEHIWPKAPETGLLIAGAESTYSAVVKRWVAQLPDSLQARVAIMDNFAEEEKPAIFSAADVVVYPSGHESFGIVFLEAWAAAKPVIGARVGAVPSVIAEDQDGLLVNHRDATALTHAIQSLLDNPELRQKLGRAGQEKVRRHYTWDIIAQQFRHVYERQLQRA